MKKLSILLSALFIALTTVWAVEVNDLASLQAALTGSDAEVTLTADIEIPESATTIVIANDKTIDLNGHTINTHTNYVIQVGEVDGTNTVTFKATNGGGITAVKGAIDVYSIAVIEGGVFNATEKNGVWIEQKGKVTVKGGTISSDNGGALVNDGGTVIVEGGTFQAEQAAAIAIQNGGTGTISNGNISGLSALSIFKGTATVSGGTLVGSNNGVEIAGNTESADASREDVVSTLTVNGGNISSTNASSGAGVYVFGKGATLTVNDGVITSPAFGISGNGTDKYNGTVINIAGGSIGSESTEVGVYHPQNGTLNISAGTITGKTAVYVKSGSVNVTGGKLVAKGDANEYKQSGNGANPTGDALVIDNCAYPGGAPTANVTGGEFESENASAVSSYVGNNVEETEKVVDFIEGGSFSGAEVLDEELVEGTATLGTPSITTDPAALAFAKKSYIKGQASVELKDTLYCDLTIANLTEALTATVKGTESIFNAEIVNNKLRVSYVASTKGNYADEVEVASGTTKTTVNVSVEVEELIPAISVNPTEWKPEAITLTNGTATAESEEFVITVENQIDPATVAIQGQNSNFSWNAQTNKVEFLADAEETYKDTLLITTTGAEPVKVPLEITVKAEQVPVQSKNFVKVTENPTDWSGEYLLVYEESETVGYVFSGGDSNNNNKEVTIEDGKIAAEGNENYVITIAPMEGGYSLKFEDKYMAGSSGSNALSFEETAALNTLSLDGDNNVDIVSNTSHMRFNSAANSMRFRYFKSTTYTGQEVVALYKLSEPEVITPTTTLTVDPKTAEIEVGETVTLSATRDGNDALVWGSKDENIATVDAKGVVTGVAEGEVKIYAVANEISDTCVVTVKKATVKPVITVNPTSLAWGTLTIEEATEGVKKEAAVSVTENATLSVEVTGDDKAAFTAAINDDKLEVTFTATEARAYAAKAVVKATDGAKDVEVALTATVKAAPVEIPSNFVKVTNEPKDWSGMYFIVYENEDKGLIFNGKDEVNGYVEGTIENNTIDASKIENYADYVVTIAPMTNGYSLKIGEQYLAGKSGSNTIVFGAEPALATISIDEDGNVAVVSNTTQFAFNSASNQMRFRFFKSDNQQAVTLYKAEAPKATTTLSVQETAEVEVGKTVTLSVTRDGNDKLTWKSMDETVATVANGVVTGVKEGEVKIAVSVGNLNDTCVVTVIEASGETITTCAEAAEAALSVSENNEEYNNGAVYTIPGYVTEIAYAWKNGSMSFWIADTEDGGKVIEAYKCAIEKEEDAVRVGDRVKVTGKLTKFNNTPEFATGCTVEIVERGEYVEPKNLGEKTIAEFLELKNTTDTCILTGIVANIVMDKDDETQYNKYGNFDLIEGTSKLYVYGLLTADGQAQKFIEMGIDAGDTLTIKAVYAEYQGKAQAKNAIFVSVKKGSGVVPPTPGEDLNVDFAEAYTTTYEGTTYWAFDAYDYENNYPELYFDFEATDLTHLNGTHEIDYSGLWTSANDSVEFVSGTATITCVSAATDDSYAVYHVDVVLYDEDGNEYSYSFDVEVVAYDGDSSTEDNIIYIELEDVPEEQGIENTEIVLDPNAPVYNIQGMQVNRNTRGILIQNGQKFILLQ